MVRGQTRPPGSQRRNAPRDVGRVALGTEVIVRANAFPGIDFPGKVVELGRCSGRKSVRTDDPTGRNDSKILEAVVRLDPTTRWVVGQRVTCYVRGS
jgi:HlyD family secretion protein